MSSAAGPSAPTLVGDEELVGEVAEVLFAAEHDGFGVVRLTGGERVTGPLAGLTVGQTVRLIGRWTAHHRYGPTFASEYYAPAPPESLDGLRVFLASDAFPGVGDVRADKLVARFGLALGEIATTEPARLAEVDGISRKLAQAVGLAWARAGVLAGLVERLAAVGVRAAVARGALAALGEEAEAVLDADPYRLLDVRGAGWADAEALARAAGVARDDPRRLVAGVVAAQRAACAREGHVALDEPALVAAARRLLVLGEEAVRRGLGLAERRRRLVPDDAVADGRWWYTPGDRAAEQSLAEDLLRLERTARRRGGEDVEELVREVDPALTDAQRASVTAALDRPVSVLTGGPGTGKTRTLSTLLAACAARDLRVALCAPTGRAARRMEEVTGHGASTIHRLLEAHGAPEGGFVFGFGADRRLPHDVVVADEWSMADTRLAAALLSALDDGAHLVCVGDADQLPSVGSGAVLRDLLDPSLAGIVAATRLDVVHRQAAQSRIVTLAHELRTGRLVPAPPHPAKDGDVFTVPEASAAVAERVAAIVAERAPDYFDVAPSEVQVLAPMYRGAAGVDALNTALKERLNPAGGRPAVAGFHEGDRVLATRNDAELDVANGDVGEVIATDRKARTVEVAFPQGSVTFGPDTSGDLAPAWCLTVHKSQGGEWPVIVLVLDPAHRRMLARELVYTAVTRAARGLLVVGTPWLLAEAGRRGAGAAAARRTGLVARLRAGAPDVGDTPG